VDEPVVPNVDVRDTYSLVQSGSQRRVDVARFVHLVSAETQLIVLQVPIDEIIVLSNATPSAAVREMDNVPTVAAA
jgi:hypothetical protein